MEFSGKKIVDGWLIETRLKDKDPETRHFNTQDSLLEFLGKYLKGEI
jgi:hypothetical protein